MFLATVGTYSSFLGLIRPPWASAASETNFLPCRTRGAKKRAKKPKIPKMGTLTSEIAQLQYPKRLILGKIFGGNIRPIGLPKQIVRTRKNNDGKTHSFMTFLLGRTPTLKVRRIKPKMQTARRTLRMVEWWPRAKKKTKLGKSFCNIFSGRVQFHPFLFVPC